MSHCLRQFGLLVVFSLIASSSGAQNPDWYNPTTMRGFKPNLPDFYQHQYWGDDADWEKEGGWCREVAVANCLYYWQIEGYQGQKYNGLLTMNADITDMTGQWQQASCDAIKKIESDYNLTTAAGYKKLLDDRGHGEKAGVLPGQGLVFQQYQVAADGKLTYKSSTGADLMRTGTAFDAYKSELLAGQDVMLRLRAPKDGVKEYDSSLWWTANCTMKDALGRCIEIKNLGGDPNMGFYHYVTGAGVDCKTMEIFFADPDSNKGSARANAGTSWRDPDANVNGRKYGPADMKPPIAPRGMNPSDDPMNYADFYGTVKIGVDGMTIVGGVDAPDRYKDIQLDRIETICPTSGILFDGINPTNPFQKDIMLAGAPNKIIDEFLIFPTVSIANSVPLSFTGDADNIWDASYVSPGAPDPWGNIRSLGGVAVSVLSGIGLGLTESEMLSGVFGAMGSTFGNFDLMFHTTDDQWLVQAYGAPEELYPQQSYFTLVPEPGAWALLAAGMAAVWRRRRS